MPKLKVSTETRGNNADSDAEITRKTEEKKEESHKSVMSIKSKVVDDEETEAMDADKTPLPPFGKGGREETPFEKGGELSMKKETAKLENPFIVKVCDRIITLSLALIFLGVPLFFTGLTLQGMNFEKLMFFYLALLLGFFAWILKAILEGKIVVKRTPLDIPIIIFILATLVSSFFSVNRWASFVGAFGLPVKSFISVLAFALFYWFLISNINKKRLKVILTALAVSIGLVSLFAVLNFFNVNIIGIVLGLFGLHPSWTQVLTENAGFNTIGLLSNLQIFVSAGILIVIGVMGTEAGVSSIKYQVLRERKGGEEGEEGKEGKEGKEGRGLMGGIKNLLLYAILLLLSLTIIVLGNFTSLIGLLIGLGVIIILAMAHLADVDKKVFGISSLLFALTLVYIIVGKPPVSLRDLPQEVGLSRQISWQISKDTFREKYFLGTGLGNFENSFNKFKPATFNNNALWNTRFSEATGIFYESLATIGGFGTVALILLILTFLGVSVYFILNTNRHECENESTRKVEAPFLFVALFAASVALGIDNALYLTGGTLLIFTVIIAALTMSIIAIYKKEYFKDLKLSYTVKPEYALALSFAFVCLSCGMILIFFSLGKVYLADIYARDGLSSDTEEMAVYKIKKAIGLFPYQYMYYEKLGDLLARVGDKEVKSGQKDMEKVQSLFIDALNSHKKAVSLSPENAFSWENLGVLSEAIVQYDPTLLNDADNSYSKAIELDPNNPALRMRLGVVKEAKADLAQNANQRESESESTQKNSADETARKNNAEVAKKMYDAALENFNKAIELKLDLTSGYDAVARIKEKLGNLNEAINYMAASYNLNRKNAFYSFNLGRLFYNRAVLGNNANQRELESESARINNEETDAFDLASSTEEESGIMNHESGIMNGKDGLPAQAGADETRKDKDAENDLKTAEALFKQAIQLQDKYVDALYSIAMLYEHKGMRKEAKEYYKKTLDALPENSEARSVVEERINNTD